MKPEDRLALYVAGFLITPLLTMLAWNLGAVGISRAANGHLHSISFWTAIGGVLLLVIVQGVIRAAASSLTVIVPQPSKHDGNRSI